MCGSDGGLRPSLGGPGAYVVIVGALGALACHAPGVPLRGVGRSSDEPRPAASAVVDPSSGSAESPVPADFATRFARLGPDSFASAGHAGGRYSATLYVSPDAQASILAARGDLAAGTQLVLTSVDRATRKPGPTFFMTKDASGWRFGVADGAKGEDSTLCARCHAEAPHDSVFALPE